MRWRQGMAFSNSNAAQRLDSDHAFIIEHEACKGGTSRKGKSAERKARSS